MAKYEKRQTQRVKLNKKNVDRHSLRKPERIKMSRSVKKTAAPKPRVEKKENNYRILHGRQPKKGAVICFVLAFLILFTAAFHFALPTGILEFLQNSYALQATTGSGCDSLMGASFLQINARYGRIDLLSGGYYEVYNTRGGTAYTVQHGYSAPVMISSAARTLVFDRGGTDCSVYNLSKQLQKLTVDGKLYTADISRGGKVALAYKSNDYLSVVEVYSRRSKLLFTHNFSEEYVTTVSINSTGRYITVTTLFSQNGIYHSNVYLFDIHKKTQISKTNYENLYFTASESLGRATSLVVGYDKAIVMRHSKGTVTELDIPDKISNYAVSHNGTIAFVCNQANNQIDNKIRLYNRKGEKKTELDFVGAIHGFSVSDTHIYILSDGVLHIYTAKDLKHTEEPFANVQFLAAFRGGAAAVSNAKLKLTKQ